MPTKTTGDTTEAATGDTNPPRPWERQPGETDRAWYAFTLHRDSSPGERSLRLTASRLFEVPIGKVTKVRMRQVQDWSSPQKYGWADRVRAWDEWVDEEARRELARDAVEMRRRHARAARALQGKALERLQTLDVSELSPKDLVRYLEVGTQIERRALGDPDITVGSSEATDDQLRDVAAARLAGRADEIRAAVIALRDATAGIPTDDEDGDDEQDGE